MFKKADFKLSVNKNNVRASHCPVVKKRQAEFDNSLDSVPDDENDFTNKLF